MADHNYHSAIIPRQSVAAKVNWVKQSWPPATTGPLKTNLVMLHIFSYQYLLQHILVIPTCSIMPYIYSYKLWQLKPLTLPIALLITSHTHLVRNNSSSPSLLWSIISALFRVKPISIMTIVPFPWIWGFCESPRQSFCPDKALQQLVIAAPKTWPPNKTSSDHSW